MTVSDLGGFRSSSGVSVSVRVDKVDLQSKLLKGHK